MTSRTKVSALDFHNQLIAALGVENASGFSHEGRYKRFSVIADILDGEQTVPRILDYGCGDGALFEYLLGCANAYDKYLGVDANPAFTAHAILRRKSRVDGCRPRFITGTVLNAATYAKLKQYKPDIVVASGVFCYSGEITKFQRTLNRLYQLSKHMCIVNVLSAEAPARTRKHTPGIVRWSVEEVASAIRKTHCNAWEIKHDYAHNDMTIVLRKHWNS